MKKLAFYVFDEHTDIEKECKRMGMTLLGEDPFASGFLYDGTVYKTLSVNECYSGWEVTLMALPEMKYEELIQMAFRSREYDERVGCLGVLLRKYPDDFLYVLKNCSQKDIRVRRIKKIILHELADRSSYVEGMHELLKLCRQ